MAWGLAVVVHGRCFSREIVLTLHRVHDRLVVGASLVSRYLIREQICPVQQLY